MSTTAATVSDRIACRQAVELLPWLLNGSLEDGEKLALTDHLGACARCRAELAETGEAWAILTRHVPSRALVQYARGLEPEGPEAEVIERHLELCASCRQEAEWATADRILAFPMPARGRRAPGWREWAIAAGVAAVLVAGALTRFAGGPAPTTLADSALAARAARTDLGSQVFVDGFESGTTAAWSHGPQPSRQPSSR